MLHGLLNTELEANLVICRPHGAFNMEGVVDYERRFAQMVADIKQPKWGIINDYTDFETGGPEVIARIRAQYKWCIANDCVAIAFVCRNSLTEFFAKQTLQDVPFKHIAYCKDEESARQWMLTCLN